MRGVGLGACKNSVVACILDDVRPTEPRQFYLFGVQPCYNTNKLQIETPPRQARQIWLESAKMLRLPLECLKNRRLNRVTISCLNIVLNIVQ